MRNLIRRLPGPGNTRAFDAVGSGRRWESVRIVESEPIPDPAAFSRRLASMMEKGLVA